jgi:hypothetical protein
LAHCVTARATDNTLTGIRAWRFLLPFREAYSSEEAAELSRLLNALPAAITVAGGLLRQLSTQHPQYLAADVEVSKILARVDELMNRKYTDADGQR